MSSRYPFYARLCVDAGRITGHEPCEPFDILAEAYHVYEVSRASRSAQPAFRRAAGNAGQTPGRQEMN